MRCNSSDLVCRRDMLHTWQLDILEHRYIEDSYAYALAFLFLERARVILAILTMIAPPARVWPLAFFPSHELSDYAFWDAAYNKIRTARLSYQPPCFLFNFRYRPLSLPL